MNSPYFYTENVAALLGDIPEDSIISRTFYENGTIKAILFGFAPGQELSEHTAAKPAILHFLSGQADVTLGTDQMNIQPGAWMYMQPQLPHSVLAKEKVIMLLLLL